MTICSSLVFVVLAAVSLMGRAAASTSDHLSSICHLHQHPGPANPDFSTGTLEGWLVVSGAAFANSSVSSVTSYWGGPFQQHNRYFLWGYAAAGDAAVGSLRSSSFLASSVMSFLVSGGYDTSNLYVALVREHDDAILLKQTGLNDEAFIRVTWDTSKWAGESVYMLAYDNSTAAFGHINLDDIRTGCDALRDGSLHFTVLGQENQPNATSSDAACTLYAADALRPQFHYTPYQGWINDPAGLIQWNGRHHLFSQFNPAQPIWGPMHWSHAESTDAVHWRNLPIALYPPYPNNPQDTSGRFTGSAVRDSNGAMRLIFTDSTDTALHPGAAPEVVSEAASNNGIGFQLHGQNPVIAQAPADSSSGFRDPKVFWDRSAQTWKMVVGSGDSSSGKVQLYQSSDLISWVYDGVLHEGDGSTGTMWECPNFFPLQDKWVLFYGGNGLGWYEVGTFNGTRFQSERKGLLDAGPDSYAMQWYQDESGRNLAVTWMGNWATSKWPSRINGWAGQQSITRDLFLRADGGLGCRPITQLSSLSTGDGKKWRNKTVTKQLTMGAYDTARLEVDVDITAMSAASFTFVLFGSSAESANLTYFVANKTLLLDTTNAGYGQSGTWQTPIDASSGRLTLDAFIDRSSLEVFAGDGTVMTATVWPKYQESRDISVTVQGGSISFRQIAVTRLQSSWCGGK